MSNIEMEQEKTEIKINLWTALKKIFFLLLTMENI